MPRTSSQLTRPHCHPPIHLTAVWVKNFSAHWHWTLLRFSSPQVNSSASNRFPLFTLSYSGVSEASEPPTKLAKLLCVKTARHHNRVDWLRNLNFQSHCHDLAGITSCSDMPMNSSFSHRNLIIYVLLLVYKYLIPHLDENLRLTTSFNIKTHQLICWNVKFLN